LAAAALSTLALGCPAAFGANQTVTANMSNAFVEASVTITQGETVTWMNVGGGLHNVHFDDDSFIEPNPPSSTDWTVYRTFAQPGTYPYYCQVHGAAGGIGMSGTVTVNPAPPGGGGGTPGPNPAPDAAPVSSLIAPPKQRVHKLFVRASMNEAGTLAATGTVSVPAGAAKVYRFKRASEAVSANQSVKLRLKLSKSGLKRVKRALRRKKRLRANITLTATDTTGKQTIRKLKVRLTR
jgi:plastocyanin